MAHKYTSEQVEFIKDNFKGIRTAELTEMLNSYFGLKLKESQIRAFKKYNGLKNGVVCKFEKGHIPVNKGKKGYRGGKLTQFKKGQKPHNYMPIGTERVNGIGYIDIKIAETNKWKCKHSLIYEQFKGSIPSGHVVIFADRNNRNFDIDNLVLVSREQLLQMNRHNLIKNDVELTKVGISIANLKIKIAKLQK